MKRFLGYFLSIIVASFLGAYIMNYYQKNNVPVNNEEKTITKVEKSVTVTDKGISDGIDNVYNAVVVVENYQKKRLSGIGSGFIYSEDGYVMTNHHVVEKASDLKIVLSSGETIPTKLIGSDEYADIAVLKIDNKYVNAIAKIGKSEETKVGDTVFTIGSPMSIDYQGTVTRGILSGKNRMVEVSVKTSNDWIMNVMQTDAAINPGNSGGPLCNVNGEVIGINSMKIVQSEIEGVGFAIPIEEALEYANNIINGVKIKKAYLGISMGNLPSSKYNDTITYGSLIIEVNPSSPAEKIGLQKGDIVIQLNEDKIKNAAQLKYYLYKHKPNEEVQVKVIRGKEEMTFNVLLGESD
jgi:serine protease Do